MNDELDLTNEPSRGGRKPELNLSEEERKGEVLEPGPTPFDPSRQRESMRGVVAGLLLVILAFIIIAAFLSYWFNWASQDQIEGLLTIVFAPMIGLVGAATGFYFGSTEARSDRG